ncbi:MAG: type III pantothenate kinase [Spirochaetia bacterium]|nr:type III pantothenate kinase [Spirochaetia bacterium]
MLLALDARNGSLTVGFRHGNAWLPLTRLGVNRTEDEYAFLLNAALDKAGPGLRPDRAWLSSVVPGLTPVLKEAVRLAFGLDVTVVGPGVKTGVKIRVDQPAELGSDLVCQAAAGYALAGGACLVVDFGAALTMAAVNGKGEFMGAAIAPGLETAATALRRTAAQLPEVRLEASDKAIGRNTPDAVRSGLILGYTGLVERLAERMRLELGEDAALIGSGDKLGRLVLDGLPALAFVPDLALDGLALIAERNTP